MNPIRVAFTGKSGSGKSTAAEYLLNRVSPSVRLSFAQPIKDLVALAYPDAKKGTQFYRKMCQDVGHAMRSIDEDFWVSAFSTISTPYRGISIIVDDLRYPNEAKMLAKVAFHVVRIERPDNPIALSGEAAAHESEKYVGGLGDTVIINDGSKEEFYKKLEDWFKTVAKYR